MFDTFDCFIGNKRVSFSSSKSKELFALLLSYNGRTLTMNDAISQLWPDGDAEKSKILYRDAVWRLRKVLNDIDIHCIEWGRGALSLDKGMIECDYWDYRMRLLGLSHNRQGQLSRGILQVLRLVCDVSRGARLDQRARRMHDRPLRSDTHRRYQADIFAFLHRHY